MWDLNARRSHAKDLVVEHAFSYQLLRLRAPPVFKRMLLQNALRAHDDLLGHRSELPRPRGLECGRTIEQELAQR
jgi:hypothetical protein